MNRKSRLPCVVLLLLATIGVGCQPPEVDTTYGRSRGSSVNGTGAFAEALRLEGHEVRAAVAATDSLAKWADVIVRLPLHPGPPDKDEGRWLLEWLTKKAGRKVVYVARDSDAEPEFWDALLAAEPKDAKPDRLDRIKREADQARGWRSKLPPKPKETADPSEWFGFAPKPGQPSTCKALSGKWAEGVDAKAAAVAKHETLRLEMGETVLLEGDGAALVASWTMANDNEVLALANASFLLNAALLNRARRPLAMRVVDWIGPAEGSKHVAFVEGASPMAEDAGERRSAFWFLKAPPFDWIFLHLLGFLLLLALAYAVRLGRPSAEPPGGVGRPSAHPEALGALLARTGQAEAAQGLLEAYRRWRRPSHLAQGRKGPGPSNPLR